MADHYALSDVITCMRISARMLEAADGDVPRLNELNCSQAKLLRSAADDLEAREKEGME